MAVTWDKGASQDEGPLVADRNLYLDGSNNKVVEEGDASSATQFIAAGHTIDRADADRLGLVSKDGKIVQDREAKIGDHQELYDQLDAELRAMNDSIAQYKKENAVKDIPNTMEKARVDLETRHEHARLALSQFIKAMAGKDPTLGESQATSIRPEKSETAKAATKRAKAAIAASPTPRELAASAPTKPAEPASPAAPAVPAKAPAAKTAAAKNASAARGKGKGK